METCYCVKRPGICGDPDYCEICPVDEERKVSSKDDVNHPVHYTLARIEVFDFIKAWDLDFAAGNVVKYVVRSPYKGTRLKDLKKARWYLDQLIKDASDE